jgi:hypothetical protein
MRLMKQSRSFSWSPLLTEVLPTEKNTIPLCPLPVEAKRTCPPKVWRACPPEPWRRSRHRGPLNVYPVAPSYCSPKASLFNWGVLGASSERSERVVRLTTDHGQQTTDSSTISRQIPLVLRTSNLQPSCCISARLLQLIVTGSFVKSKDTTPGGSKTISPGRLAFLCLGMRLITVYRKV